MDCPVLRVCAVCRVSHTRGKWLLSHWGTGPRRDKWHISSGPFTASTPPPLIGSRQLSRQHPLLTTLIPQGAHRAAIVPRTTPLSRLQKAGSTAADDGANDDASSDNTNDTSLNFIVTYSVRKLSARHTIRSRKTKTLLVLQPTDCLVCDSTSVSRTFQRLFYRIHMKPRTSITQTHVYIIYIARN